MKLNLAYNILISSAITKSVVYGHQAAPHTRSLGTSTMEELVGDGCRNSVSFNSRTITQDGSNCVTSTLCEDSQTSSMFVPTAKDICVAFSEDEPKCSAYELVTSFEKKWVMKHVTMRASKMDPSFDPKSIKVLASNDKVNWIELFSAELEFENREERIGYVVNNEDAYKHYSIQFEKLKKIMYIGKLGLVESYTRKCTADLYHNITGVSLPLYTTMAPTMVPTNTPNSYDFTNRAELKEAVDLWFSDSDEAENIYGHIKNWGVGLVKDMSYLFRSPGNYWEDSNNKCLTFNEDLSLWNTAQVTNMDKMFIYCKKFNSDISGWNTARVTNMASAFRSNEVFNQDLSTWDSHNVTSMSYMFFNAKAFNRNISTWNTHKVNKMDNMFYGAAAFNQNISTWNIQIVADMNHMFFNAAAFSQKLCSWNTTTANTHNMFTGTKGGNMNC